MSYPSETDCRNCGETPCGCTFARAPKRLDWTAPSAVCFEVMRERERQHAKWGEQNHPDGTGLNEIHAERAEVAKHVCQSAFAAGEGTYMDILHEEVCEAFAESDPAKLRAELVQVAAVAVAWIEKIDRDTARAGVSDAR